MTDKQFLQWIHDRLHEIHGENENFDYMHKLRNIIDVHPVDTTTPNVGRPANEPNHEELLRCVRALPTALMVDNHLRIPTGPFARALAELLDLIGADLEVSKTPTNIVDGGALPFRGFPEDDEEQETEQQPNWELAAREYCRLAGLDPFDIVDVPCTDNTGIEDSGVPKSLGVGQEHLIIIDLQDHHNLSLAIKKSMENSDDK